MLTSAPEEPGSSPVGHRICCPDCGHQFQAVPTTAARRDCHRGHLEQRVSCPVCGCLLRYIQGARGERGHNYAARGWRRGQ